MLVYTNKNHTTSCVIWDIDDDSVGQSIVEFSVNGCNTTKSPIRHDPDCGEIYFDWKEITFYLSDFKEI